jgi:hypothetical protein
MPATPHLIEVHIERMEQLFNSMDPAPFHSKHLDSDAEEYIVSAASRHPVEDGARLVVHLDDDGEKEQARGLVPEAVRHYFAYRADRAQRELLALLATGRTTLLIGLLFMGACVTASQLMPPIGGETFASVLREGLIIVGWVAMWRPMQIFLYDWWPIARQRRVFLKLARMEVEVR